MVSLSKHSWHYKLQRLIIGSKGAEIVKDKDITRNNLCPYFWLTIFCMLFGPFYGIYRVAKYLIPNFVYNPYINWKAAHLTDKQVYACWIQYLIYNKYDDYNTKTRIFAKWRDSFASTEEFEKELDRIIAEQEALEQEDLNQGDNKRSALIELIIEKTKKFAPWIIGILVIGCLYGLGLFIAANWKDILVFVLIAVFLIGIVSTIVILAKGWDFLWNETSLSKHVLNYWEKGAIPKKIKSFFHIFIEYFKAAKKDLCPGIKWDE